MTTKKIALFFLLFVPLCLSPFLLGCNRLDDSGESSSGFETATMTRLQNIIDTTRTQANAKGMIIGIWYPGKGDYIGVSGSDDIAQGSPIDPSKLFRAGSITKTFVTTVALQLVDEGLISLDDPLSKHIPNIPNGNRISLKMLFNHTSGLPNYTDSEIFWNDFYADRFRQFSVRELLDYAFALPMQAEPGVEYHYSNTNTTLLGMIIEQYSHGESLARIVQKRVIEKIGLSNTSFATTETFPGPYIHGFQATATGTFEDWSIYNPSWMWAAGAIISNMNDLKTYMRSICRNEHTLLSPELQARRLHEDWISLRSPMAPTLHYGLGWAKIGGFIFHDGSTSGYHSLIAFDPTTGVTVAMNINTEPEPGSMCVLTLIEVIKTLFPDRPL